MLLLFIIARLLLATLFLLAGARKFWNISAFHQSMLSFQLVSGSLSHVLAWTFPMIEVIAGIAILIGIATRTATVTIAILLVIFSGAITITWIRKQTISCGCFGESKVETSYSWMFTRNTCLLGLAGLVLFAPTKAQTMTITVLVSREEVVALPLVLGLLFAGSFGFMLLNLRKILH